MSWEKILKGDKEIAKKLLDMQNRIMHEIGNEKLQRAIDAYNEMVTDLGEHGQVISITPNDFLAFIGKISSGFEHLADDDDGWRGGGTYNIKEQ